MGSVGAQGGGFEVDLVTIDAGSFVGVKATGDTPGGTQTMALAIGAQDAMKLATHVLEAVSKIDPTGVMAVSAAMLPTAMQEFEQQTGMEFFMTAGTVIDRALRGEPNPVAG